MNNLEKIMNNLEKYWEKILKSEGLGDIDESLGIKNNISFPKINKKVDLIISGDEFIKNFEKENPDLKVNINFDFGEIDIENEKGLVIGHIGQGIINFEGFENAEHLYIEVDQKYRRKNIGKFLFELYTKYSKTEKNFIIPDEDYTFSPSTLNFYLKNNIYSIVEVYNPLEKSFEELSLQEIKKLKNNKEEYFLDDFGEKILYKLSKKDSL